MSEALGATTPEVPVAPAAGQPAQPQGGMPEGQQLAPEMQAPDMQPAEQDWFLKADTGTVYKTPEAAAAGIAEKDRFIQQLLAERQQWQGQQPQQQPQFNPQDAATQAISQLQAEWEQELRSDPKFQGATPEAIAEQAYLNAKAEYRVQRRFERQQQETRMEAEWKAFEQSQPDLKHPLAAQLWQRSVAQGTPYPSPYALLDAVHAEMYRQGIQRSQPQAASAGVQGAMQYQQQQRQMFSGTHGGAGAAPQALSETVRKQIEFAQGRGYTGEALERIKQRAIENEARMAKR